MRRQWERFLQLSAARQVRVLMLLLLLLVPGLLVGSALAALNQQHTVRHLTLAVGPGTQLNKDALLQVTQAQADWERSLGGTLPRGRYPSFESEVGATLDRLAVALSDHELDEQHRAQYAPLVERQHEASTAWFEAARAAERLRDRPIAQRGPAEARARQRFTAFRQANSELEVLLTRERDTLRVSARDNIAVVLGVDVLGAAGAVLVVLLAGRVVDSSVLVPLGRLRSVVQRQRDGDDTARADERHGAAEIRGLAADYNELVGSRRLLYEEQARMLELHRLSLDVARRVNSAENIDEALESVCSSVGRTLGVDRALLYSIDDDGVVESTAQYHRLDLPPLPQLPPSLMSQVAVVNDELRRDATVLALEDLLRSEARADPRAVAYHRATGARSLLMVPIGLGERDLGLLLLMTVDLPRRWRSHEIQGMQQCASYVAHGIVAARLAKMQSEQVARLTAFNRQKTDFMATVSHELRTPLTSISGYLELLDDGDYGELSGPQRGALAVIDRNTARLRGLIEDLLVLNKIETFGLQTQPEDVAVSDVVSAVVEVLQPTAANGRVELVVQPASQDLCVHVDRTHLERALINLGSNAVKFTPAGGQVTLTAERSGSRIAISVSDTGIGIPHEDLARLGDRFFRASNATARAIPGTGLGLAIVRTIVEGHGGEMFVASAEGEGTTVRLLLPAADDAARQRPADGGAPSALRDGSATV